MMRPKIEYFVLAFVCAGLAIAGLSVWPESATGQTAPTGCSGGCCGATLTMEVMAESDAPGGTTTVTLQDGETAVIPAPYYTGDGDNNFRLFIKPVQPAGDPNAPPICNYQCPNAGTWQALRITYPDGHVESMRYQPEGQNGSLGMPTAYVGGNKPGGEGFLGPRDIPASGNGTWSVELRCCPHCNRNPCCPCGSGSCASGSFSIQKVPAIDKK